jgi:hypothetical protein
MSDSDPDRTYNLPGGAWWSVTCPACNQPQMLYASIGVKLTVPSDAAAKIQLTAKALAVEHDCQQLQITIDGTTGQLLDAD